MSYTPTLSTAHRRRLRDIWRSAGWPCQDVLEVELLVAGLLERVRDGHGRETLRVTDAGLQVLAATLQRNRAARDAHEALVARVALELQRAGRIAWCGLSLRARVPDADHPAGERWRTAMPDVFSVRHTTVAGYLQPEVHEIKVRRADLLADLRVPGKRAAYLGMAGACWYVLAEGVGEADEIPPECGVMRARGPDFGALEVLRPAPARALPFEAGLPFAVWMALARAAPVPAPEDDPQRRLGAPNDPGDPGESAADG
ncbi:MAG TPA: hypothetical protein VFQ16_10025 [Burkholderiaceae bacterium]|nr:hypothetical protein [Burkholderiaceae bacterium]